ncbi:hypothetical protein KY317_03590, partial [Candidatus Woesearchaeota archaeon]|nr:hypothetical protein [Candidatus Woesearchaeota archaeon]
LNAELPYCSWGIVRGEKDGYETGEAFVSTETPGRTSVYLVPLSRITEYEVVKHKAEFTGSEWIVSASAERLKGDESAAIYIEKDEYSTSGVYPADELMPLVFFSDGTFDYVLRLYLLDGDSIKGGYLGSWTVEQYEMSEGTKAVFHVVYVDEFADELQQAAFMYDDSLKQISDYEFLSPELI